MTILGIVLIILALTIIPSHILLIVGIILALVGFLGNGYGHFGRPAGSRRYWY